MQPIPHFHALASELAAARFFLARFPARAPSSHSGVVVRRMRTLDPGAGTNMVYRCSMDRQSDWLSIYCINDFLT